MSFSILQNTYESQKIETEWNGVQTAIDLSHVTSLQMSRESCGNKNIVCMIHLYFENEKEKKSEKIVYSLGIDAADEADASHWFSVLQERVESCRVSSKDCDDEEDGAINMTSLPLMVVTLQDTII